MKLVDSVARSFRVAKVFRENSDQVNSVDFAPNGETLITASNDDSMVIYDCAFEGKSKRTLFSKKYGVTYIKYTHAGDTVIYGSNKVDDAIRYQSLHDNKYIRYYSGHTSRVLCLCMSPVDDTFLSGSLDSTIRLWDLRSANCQGLVNMPYPPVAAFDPEGLIFAAGLNSELIKMYDLRSFDKGPFTTFRLQRDKKSVWTDLKFSPDGMTILITSNGTALRLIDAFNGKPLHDLTGHINTKNLCLEASFSPDGQYILSGSENGHIFVYDVDSGSVVADLDGRCQDPLRCVKFNPHFMMLTSASSSLSFWLPTVEE